AVSEHHQPIFCKGGATSKPAKSLSMISKLMSSCPVPSPVRTAVVTKSARTPEVMNVFAPETRYSSPSRTALVVMLATSLPPPGSVMPSEPISSPSRVGRTYRSIWSAFPPAAIWGTAMPCEQGGHEPGGGAGDDGGFGHDGNVDDVAALAADILAKPDPLQSGFGGLAVEPERHVPGGFPFVQVRHDFIAHECRCGLGQRAALGGF